MNVLIRKMVSWKRAYREREYYLAGSRLPFYDVAGRYLPSDENGIIVDIGAGEGLFAQYLNLDQRYKNLQMLDANELTVATLKRKFNNALLYKAPGRLPFEDASVSYIHCSHLVEHLYYGDVYCLLKEIDRVLRKEGIFVISTALLWEEFYKDLSHVKPYYPSVFTNYLCTKSTEHSEEMISESYSICELVYRYANVGIEEWGSGYALIDFLISVFRKSLTILQLRKYVKNGYTLVLKKV